MNVTDNVVLFPAVVVTFDGARVTKGAELGAAATMMVAVAFVTGPVRLVNWYPETVKLNVPAVVGVPVTRRVPDEGLITSRPP